MDNLYKIVGSCYDNKNIPIISNGERYFTLELKKGDKYVDCYEVSDEKGMELFGHNNVAIFEPLYKLENGNLINSGYRLLRCEETD